nr:hypothetical protein [Torque teno Leptonychotes weddellii virus 3]
MGSGFQDVCNLYKVCFDLLYDTSSFFTGMPDNYEEWPITRVKLIYGRLEATWLTFQILVALTSLTLIILTHIKDLKPSGNN